MSLDQQSQQTIDNWCNFYLKEGQGFWLHRKNKSLGRPFDAQYQLNDVAVKDGWVRFRYDDNQSIAVLEPQQAFILRDLGGTIHLVIRGFGEIEQINVDYGISEPSLADYKTTREPCNGDELRLVGHSPDISEPSNYNDAAYQSLFKNAAILKDW